MEEREFDLGAILNATTCRLFTSMDDVYDVYSYLMGHDVYTHSIPRYADEIKAYILSEYPELKGVGDDVVIKSFDDAKAFVDEQKKVFGEKLVLRPMSKTDKPSNAKY